uniref:TGS domain-containing protein n=1 Tax=Mantoniella antarctica TaxID=81844 RepID=A0A7S0X9U9_9CHLO
MARRTAKKLQRLRVRAAATGGMVAEAGVGVAAGAGPGPGANAEEESAGFDAAAAATADWQSKDALAFAVQSEAATAAAVQSQAAAAVDDEVFDDVSDSDDDKDEDEVIPPEETLLIRTGHARQVAWLSNIREWQEEFLGVLTAEEFVDTVTGDLLGRRVFVFTPSGGVMNLPHGSTVVDYAFYTDTGLDMIEAKVNGVAVGFDWTLSNADVVEIMTQEDSVTEQKIALQRRFLHVARTRSARYKIQKFLTEHGAMPGDSTELVSAAAPSSDLDIIDVGAKNDAVIAAARAVTLSCPPPSPNDLKKFSTVKVWLRCRDRNGLLAEISDSITKLGGCSIVGYSGSGLHDGSGEFGMAYTMQLDPQGKLANCLLSTTKEGATELAEQRLMEIDSRLTLLYRELMRNGAVLESQLFCDVGVGDGSGRRES